jgi:ABC-2 type transport system ATP-binding protein
LVHRPPVIVLDEPTAGVDVELRQTLWQFIRRLNRDGHTILLTTHYLEEAEMLCGRIAMLKAGRLVALDTTANLLQRFSVHALRLRLLQGTLPPALSAGADEKDGIWSLPFDRFDDIEGLLGQLRAAGCVVDDVEIGKPDLEDVFVKVMHADGGVTT